jgi:hypothetical protein
MQNRAWGPGTPTESAASNTQGQKADHYMLYGRTEMRSGAYASSVRIPTMRGPGVVRSFDPGSITRGTVCLTSVCVYKAI